MSQADDSVSISVVIPVWNDPDRLRMCLEALESQTLGRERFEVIVVDNASTDDTPAVARSFDRVQLLVEQKKGSYSARNTGVRHARGKYIAFTDADCIPSPGWLANGLARIEEEPDLSVLGGKISLFATEGNSSRPCVNYERLFAFNQQRFVEKWGVAATANLFCSRDLIQAVNGFNESLMSGGDTDFTRRITARGSKLIYVDAAEVSHPTRGTWRAVVAKHLRVESGAWDRARGRFKIFRLSMAALRTTVARSYRVLRAGGYSAVEKAELVVLLWMLFGATLLEYARRLLGGPARR